MSFLSFLHVCFLEPAPVQAPMQVLDDKHYDSVCFGRVPDVPQVWKNRDVPESDPPNGKNMAEKYYQKSGRIRFLLVFDVFGSFWFVFGVLEARDPFQKLLGGDTLQFHRI